MECLAEDTVLGFVAGGLAPERIAEVDEHVDACPTCRRLLVLVARGSSDAPPGTSVALSRGATVGRYVIEDVLGEGGMGIVYAARDPELDRRVALKLLRHATAGADAAERLRREGRAVAKLAHPHVVAVFDVGTYEDSVFVAMEFIDGSSLDRWLAEPRPWRDVVRVFLQAGEGLAAAHAAGMVHRDFKPANVLLGSDGRARVSDFGLARLDDREPRAASTRALDPVENTKLTITGAVLGTPAYMSPEQFEARAVDARSDQFSFAVALYEALFGQRPFAGSTIAAIYTAIIDENVAPQPHDSTVPTWLRQVVLRGLRARPEARYAALDDMLAALRVDPRARRRRVLAVAGGTVAIGMALAGMYVFARSDPASCDISTAALAGTWDATRAASVRRAFIATGKPFAGDTADRVGTLLDAWATSWAAHGKAACEAKARSSQSAHVFDLRTACFERRRQEVDGLVSLLEHADAPTMTNAVNAAAALAPVSTCDDVDGLMAAAPKPVDPKTRAAIVAAEQELAKLRALVDLDDFKQAIALGEALLDKVAKLGWKPLEADVLYSLAHAQDRSGDSETAAKSLARGELAAEAGHADVMLATIRAVRVYVVGYRLVHTEQGLELADRARAAIERVGSPADLEARFENSLGTLAWRQGKFEDALAHYQRSRERYEASSLARSPEFALVENNIGSALWEQGRFKDAEVWHRRALALAETALGKDHPQIASITDTLAISIAEQGRLADAIPLQQRALALREKNLGSDAPGVAISLVNIADTLRRSGDPKAAIEQLQRARTIFTKALGADHPNVAFTYHNAGVALMDLHEFDRARTELESGLAIRKKAFAGDHPLVGASYLALAENDRRADHPKAALVYANQAIAILGKGENDVTLGQLLNIRGLIQLGIPNPAAAIADLERALSLYAKTPPSPINLAEARAGLARALLASPTGDRARARRLANEAKATFEAEHATEDLAELESTLKQLR